MTFQVLWLERAIAALARAYLQANDARQSAGVTSAMARVDQLLETSRNLRANRVPATLASSL